MQGAESKWSQVDLYHLCINHIYTNGNLPANRHDATYSMISPSDAQDVGSWDLSASNSRLRREADKRL